MDIFNFSQLDFLSFLLTLMRISVVLFMFPLFDANTIPTQWKASASLILTMAIWPSVSISGLGMPSHPFEIVLLLFGEIVLGLALGLSVKFFFAGIQSGGEIIAMQMGFSMINFADPLSGNNTGLIAHFLYMVSTLTFLALDGHLHMLRALVHTFDFAPVGDLVFRESLLRGFIHLSGNIFLFAIKIVSPVMAVLFLIEVGLGMLTRATPQLPVMEVGFPLKISVGLFFISMLFTVLAAETERFVIGIGPMFDNILRGMR